MAVNSFIRVYSLSDLHSHDFQESDAYQSLIQLFHSFLYLYVLGDDSLLQLKELLDHALRIERSSFNTWIGKQISVSHVRTFQMKQITPDTIFQICSTTGGMSGVELIIGYNHWSVKIVEFTCVQLLLQLFLLSV